MIICPYTPMRTTRFYLPQPLSPDARVELSPEASHHAFTVLRLKKGAPLTVFNGEGGEYAATIVDASKKSVVIQTSTFNPVDNESPLLTHLAIGISKGERFDLVLQKATELGVSNITPLFTERTEVRLNQERQEKKQQHWQNIIIHACEQSQRNRLPKLHPPMDISALVDNEKSEQKFILHHHSQQALDKNIKLKSVCLLVGPEGGFSDEEFQRAVKQGFAPLALGPRVLRTETAPLAGLSAMQLLWGDFS
jgi:16S rRNA (uracil1498-N3)-methyltransferase